VKGETPASVATCGFDDLAEESGTVVVELPDEVDVRPRLRDGELNVSDHG
jgi:hypothetical protein